MIADETAKFLAPIMRERAKKARLEEDVAAWERCPDDEFVPLPE